MNAEARYCLRMAVADERRSSYGLIAKRNCFVCGRFKSAPSSVCGYCGDDPVSHNGDPRDFDRAYRGG